MDPIEICNVAIGLCGGNLIISLDDETTEAKLCKAMFAHLRDAVLEEIDWSFAKKQARITPLATSPVFRFDNQFAVPSDCIRIVTAGGSEYFDDLLDWERNADVVLANTEVLYLLYIARIEDTTKFSIGFAQTLAQRLAADLSVSLNENQALRNLHWRTYLEKLRIAASNDGMQGRQQRIKKGPLRNLRRSASPFIDAG